MANRWFNKFHDPRNRLRYFKKTMKKEEVDDDAAGFNLNAEFLNRVSCPSSMRRILPDSSRTVQGGPGAEKFRKKN